MFDLALLKIKKHNDANDRLRGRQDFKQAVAGLR